MIGALGVVTPSPLLGKPDQTGDIGLLAYELGEPRLTTDQILHFLTVDLPNITSPFPTARSIIIMDNMPTHRANERAIRSAL